MAGGITPVLNLQGKVTAQNELVVVFVTNSGTVGPRTPIAHLQGSVDGNNALTVTGV